MVFFGLYEVFATTWCQVKYKIKYKVKYAYTTPAKSCLLPKVPTHYISQRGLNSLVLSALVNNPDIDTTVLFLLSFHFMQKIRLLNRLWRRYSSFNSGKILFDGQLWRSVGILPPEKIEFFLDVVYHYNLNFHLRK